MFWECLHTSAQEVEGWKPYLKPIPHKALSCGSNWVQLPRGIIENPNSTQPIEPECVTVGSMCLARQWQVSSRRNSLALRLDVISKHSICRTKHCTIVSVFWLKSDFLPLCFGLFHATSWAPAEVMRWSFSSISSTAVVFPRLGHKPETTWS